MADVFAVSYFPREYSHAWFWTGSAWVPPGPATGLAPLWWHPGSDTFDGQLIDRFDVAATGASSPVPPGLPRDPAVGRPPRGTVRGDAPSRATRRQVSLLAATESTAAAALGTAAGFGLFFLLRIPVAGIPFLGAPFFPGDLSLSLLDVLVVAIGVPAAAAVAARLALRRVHISPLGVARRATPKPPGAWRVVPLLAGLAELGFWTVHGHPASISGQIQAFVSSFAIILVGLFIAGPWLTMAAARVMARWTSRPGTLIAARRLADDPRAAYRAVSGLVLALFITTVAVVAITT